MIKCHCGLECEIHDKLSKPHYFCLKHGFQGWCDTEGFELLLKTRKQIESMIADIEVYHYEKNAKLAPYMSGYVRALKWVLGEMDK